MEIIDFNELDFENLDLINCESREASIFYNNTTAYKIFCKRVLDNCSKEEKVEILNKLSHKNIVIPIDKVYREGKFCGYSMEYLNCYPLYQIYLPLRKLIALFKDISEVLKWFHKNDIMVGDFNLTNILYNDSDFKFIDLDSYKIGSIKGDNIPSITYNLISKYEFIPYNKVIVDENFDRLSLILNFLYMYFGNKTFYRLDEKDVDDKIILFNDKQKQLVKTLYHKNPLEINIPHFEDIF